MRIYIAGPMTGVPDFNYPLFHRVAEDLRLHGHGPLNPARSEGREGCATWLHYMRAALRDLADCDGVATLPGWQASRGASLEVHIAHRLSLPVRPWLDWVRP